MHAVIATYGTTGDVEPLLALSREMCKRGHNVKFCAPPDFARRIESFGLVFVPLGPPMDPLELREIYGRASLSSDVVQHVERTLPLVIRDAPQMIEELIEACKGADVLISLPYQLAGRIVHELTNIPLVTVHLSPFGGYSRRFAATTSHMINRLRSSYDLKPLEDILGVGGSSPILALYAVTPKLFRRPKHWPPHHVMTGFFFSPDESALHPELEAFLDNGDRPIVVSFGSVLHDSPVKLADLIIGSIRMTGMRAVIQRGWSDLQFSNTPDNIHITGFASHHKLFPRASCVVHAGGAGTTAATLKSGVPAVIVPHVLDQFLWANLARERGLASDVIPFPELSLRRLTSAIQAAASTPSYLNHAAAFSKSLHRENGVSAAVDLIESCIQSDQRGVVTALTTLRGDDGQRN